MFKGYTGKLTSIQRRSFMRAAREAAQGNNWAAAQHIAYGAKMTMVGSAMIPFIRNGVKMTIAGGGAELLELMGITEEEYASLGDYGLAYAEKSSLDTISQLVGMTMIGDALDTMITKAAFPERRFTEGPSGPFGSTLQQLWRGVDSMFFTKTDAPTHQQVKKWLTIIRSTGSFGGFPGFFGNTGNSIISQMEKNTEASYKRNRGTGVLKDWGGS